MTNWWNIKAKSDGCKRSNEDECNFCKRSIKKRAISTKNEGNLFSASFFVEIARFVSAMLSVRPANSTDFSAILELQERNHLSNLDGQSLGDGFLTTYLTPEKLDELSAQNGVFIARGEANSASELESELAGFACGHFWDFSDEHEFHRAVLGLFPLALGELSITANNSFQYRPVCIAARLRGQGIIRVLSENLKGSFRSRREFGISFIDHRNARSLAARTRKAGFQVVAQLPFGQTIHHVLGFSTQSSL